MLRTTIPPEQAAALYVAAWNAPDADTRFSHLLAATHTAVTLLDPHLGAPLTTRAALASHIADIRTRLTAPMEPRGGVEAHHGTFRLRWRFAPDGAAPTDGETIAHLDPDDGRITHLAHYLDT